MTRFAIALLLLLLAIPLAAQEDVAVTLTLDSTTALTGDRAEGTLTVRNNSATAVQNVSAIVALDPEQQEITITEPAGWFCDDGRIRAQCYTASMAANTQVSFRFSILTRNDLTVPSVRIEGSAFLSEQDANPANDRQVATLTLAQHPTTTALSVAVAAQQSPVPRGGIAVITVNVRNDGPAAASNLRVHLQSPFLNHTDISAPGWTCAVYVCRRPSLGVGETAPITTTFPTTLDTVYTVRAEVGAEDSFDPNGADNRAEGNLVVGNASEWKRVLLPVVMRNLPGLNGSIWETDITAVIESDTASLFPRACVRTSCFAQIPLRTPFRPSDYGIAGPSAKPTTFLYSAADQSDRISYNLRVRDLTRTSETWGTEVPAVREEEFRTAPILLMPLPVDPLFRTTIRVYDFDARAGAQVAIHVYADEETTPRATLVRTFTTWPDTVTTVQLPVYPGYIQVDLGEVGAALAGAETAWMRIEPRTEGLKFWAFASVTNNPTGHVTTVTPQ